MVELVTFLTGSVFLFFALKLLLMKVFVDILKGIVLHPYMLTILGLCVVAYIIMPDIVTPYYDLTITYFVNGITSIFTFIFGIIEDMFSSLL